MEGGVDVTPFDEEDLPKNNRDAIPSSTSSPPPFKPAKPPSSSSSSAQTTTDAAIKIGSSISDLGQHLFHHVDRVSSKLVGEAGAYGFFSDEKKRAASASAADVGNNTSSNNNLPPPSPLVAVSTEFSTSTDEHDDTDVEEEYDDDDDDDKTAVIDNTAKSARKMRIARLRSDRQTMEEKTKIPSPSSLSSFPRYRNRRAVAQRSALTTTTTNNSGLPRIPELRNASALVDAFSDEDDGSVDSSMHTTEAIPGGRKDNAQTPPSERGNGSGDEIEASYLAAGDTTAAGDRGKNDGDSAGGGGGLPAITIVHGISNSMRGLATSVLSVQMNSAASSEDDRGNSDSPAIRSVPMAAGDDDCLLLERTEKSEEDVDHANLDSSGQNKRKLKKCRLSKLTVAAILLFACVLIVILAAILRPDESNLRGGSSLSTSSTTSPISTPTSTLTSTTTSDADDVHSVSVAPGVRIITDGPTTRPSDLPTKAPTAWTSTGLPPLEYLGTLGPFGLCEGDCDNDNDCLPGLVCYVRDGYDLVPGCDTMPGVKHVDYCTLPGGTHYPTMAPVPTASPTQSPTLSPTKKPTEAVVVEEKETKDSRSFSFYVMVRLSVYHIHAMR